MIFAFADREAAAYVLGKGWLAEALTTWRVRVVVIEIDEVLRDDIRAAQTRQAMRDMDDEDDEDGGSR